MNGGESILLWRSPVRFVASIFGTIPLVLGTVVIFAITLLSPSNATTPSFPILVLFLVAYFALLNVLVHGVRIACVRIASTQSDRDFLDHCKLSREEESYVALRFRAALAAVYGINNDIVNANDDALSLSRFSLLSVPLMDEFIEEVEIDGIDEVASLIRTKLESRGALSGRDTVGEVVRQLVAP
jgi:hypothetical protein